MQGLSTQANTTFIPSLSIMIFAFPFRRDYTAQFARGTYFFTFFRFRLGEMSQAKTFERRPFCLNVFA